MKLLIKFFIFFIGTFHGSLQTSAPLTKENLKRLQQGLPLKLQFKPTIKRQPLTKQERHALGVAYLRQQKTKEVERKINKFFETLKRFYQRENQLKPTPYTRYEQEKLKRTDSSQRYPSLDQYFQQKKAAKS